MTQRTYGWPGTGPIDLKGNVNIEGDVTLDSTLSFPLGSVGSPTIYPGTDTNTGIWSPQADTWALSNGGTETLRTDSSNRLLVGVTSGNANGGILQLSRGITFPSTTIDATDVNTLDDYEEGTFTPTIAGATTAGSGTYSAQVGAYTKIGKMVFYRLSLTWTAHTGTGNMEIRSLPFTNGSDQPVPIMYTTLTSPASTFVLADMDGGTTTIRLFSVTLATGTRTALAMDTNAAIDSAGCYAL